MERNHKIKANYGMQQYWNYYNSKKVSTKYGKVSQKEFSVVLNKFLECIRDEISLENKAYVMPYRLGTIELLKSKPEPRIDEEGKVVGLPINFKATMDLRAQTGDNTLKVYHFNSHTDGYVIKAAYRKYRALFKKKTIYALSNNRTLKRNISKTTLDGNIDIDFVPLKYKQYEEN